MITLRQERPADVEAREALLDEAFGDTRYRKPPSGCAKAACRPTGLSFVAAEGKRVVGTARLWNIACGGRPAGAAARPGRGGEDCRGRGIGAALVRRALEAARRLGHGAVILVGDAPYYSRFGFAAAKTGALGCPARSSAIACSRSNSFPARSTAPAA